MLAQTGLRIRELRTKRGYTQAALARAADITQATLSNYETGKRGTPIHTALALAGALDVTLGEILGTSEAIVLRDSRLGVAAVALARQPALLKALDRRVPRPASTAGSGLSNGLSHAIEARP